MGEVYLAHHTVLDRPEALKVLLPRLASESEFVSRFRREARALNRVQHPSIVSVYDSGQLPDGRLYLATEYIDGLRLDEVVRAAEGGLPVWRVLHILVQLADALDHAHQRGVIHRDLKPSNLLLVGEPGPSEVLKILDFGIAKIIAHDYEESHVVSQDGVVFGSPAYLAPEVWQGRATEPALDIYAAGCIAYKLVTGSSPFRGSQMELMHAHLTERPVPPRERCPDRGISEELEAVVMCCMEKKAEQRFDRASRLREALERVPGYRGRPHVLRNPGLA
jgi:serine/threonine-protein kinase